MKSAELFRTRARSWDSTGTEIEEEILLLFLLKSWGYYTSRSYVPATPRL